jgi:zinc protease
MSPVFMHLARPAIAAAWAFIALTSPATWAQPFDTPPPPAAPRPLSLAAPQEQTLPSGLRVVVAERRGLPLVTAQLLVLSGAEADPPERPGLAALTAGLLTRGTRSRSAPAQVQAAEALGGLLDSSADWHRSTVQMTVTTPRLGQALALLADAALQPAFASAELQRLRAEMLDELKVRYASPGTQASLAAQQAVFGIGAYGRPVRGTPASLQAITRADVLALHRAHYRPDNAVLVLAGDIGLAEAVALARQHLGGWKAPAQPLPAPMPVAGTPGKGLLTLVDLGQAAGQASVTVALPVPARGAADNADGAVTNAVLGLGYSSRMNQEIRIKRGLSYSAGSSFDARRSGGLLLASAQTKNESAAEVLQLMHTQLDSLLQAPVPGDELTARRATLIGNLSRSVETTAGLAGQVAALVTAGLPPDALRGRIAALEAVDAAAVQRYARQHFGADQRRAVVAGNAAQFEPALRAAVPGLVKVAPLAANTP